MSQYPTGPAVTIDPIVTSFDHPALLALYSYWFATGAIAVAFVLYRARRSWKGAPHAGKSPGSSTSPGSEDGASGGFGRAQGDSKSNLPHPAASAVLDDGQPSPVQTNPATGYERLAAGFSSSCVTFAPDLSCIKIAFPGGA